MSISAMNAGKSLSLSVKKSSDQMTGGTSRKKGLVILLMGSTRSGGKLNAQNALKLSRSGD